MKEIVEVLLLVFIILGSLVVVKVSMQGEMKMRSFLSPDYQLSSMKHKYDAIIYGIAVASNYSFSGVFYYCRLNSDASQPEDGKNCIENEMSKKLESMNNSIEQALSGMQQLGYVQYDYWISDYRPQIRFSDPIMLGVRVHMRMTAPNAKIYGERTVWVNTGMDYSDMLSNPRQPSGGLKII